MKNFAIHKSINSRVQEVALHGCQTKEGVAFRKMNYKLSHRLKSEHQLRVVNARIEMLDLAEKLAREDKSSKNFDENFRMQMRCSAGKIELMNMKESLYKVS